MSDTKISLVVETTDGRPLRCFSHAGKTFVESPDNREYQLRVKNKIDRRIKVVVSVDSLNIVSGKPAGDDPSETGYILQPYEEQIFKGYRVDDNTVAQFTFVKREKSYATEVGSGAGNGVIAVRAYEEKETEAEKQLKKLKQRVKDLESRPREKEYIPYDPWPYRPWRPYWEKPYHYWGDTWYSTCGGTAQGMSDTLYKSSLTSSFGDGNTTMFNACAMPQNAGNDGVAGGSILRAAAMQSSIELDSSVDESPFSMGSSWGSAIKDSVKMVEFEVGKLVGEVTIYYAHLEGLKALGVNVERTKSVAFPEPFKREFCAKPSGWKG